MQVFLLAAPLLVAVGAAADATALLQDGLLLQKAPEPEPEGNCTCLDWSWAFANHSLPCLVGLGDLKGQEFCDFILPLKSNICLQKQFMAPSVGESICLVKGSCKGSTPVAHGVNSKICKSGEDKLATEMSLGETTALALSLGVDQGCMAGYAATYVNKLASSMSAQELDAIKASGTPTFVWSMADHFADRWEIRGKSVYVHKFSPQGFWEVSCREGC
mmetsp:Transcript_84434/g.239369  ORF Transcript_84434/g.239369 Transcript_84434/m.239369 type:complete len:218 (+) Transcript_84434:63-716(+)